jgi:hypothetical protein
VFLGVLCALCGELTQLAKLAITFALPNRTLALSHFCVRAISDLRFTIFL